MVPAAEPALEGQRVREEAPAPPARLARAAPQPDRWVPDQLTAPVVRQAQMPATPRARGPQAITWAPLAHPRQPVRARARMRLTCRYSPALLTTLVARRIRLLKRVSNRQRLSRLCWTIAISIQSWPSSGNSAPRLSLSQRRCRWREMDQPTKHDVVLIALSTLVSAALLADIRFIVVSGIIAW